ARAGVVVAGGGCAAARRARVGRGPLGGSWSRAWGAGHGPLRVSPPPTTRHTRCRNRYAPTTSLVAHGRDASSGPIDISYTRSVSAPYSSQISSGDTEFFRLLPILPNSWFTSISPAGPGP